MRVLRKATALVLALSVLCSFCAPIVSAAGSHSDDEVVVTVAPYYTLNESASGYSYLQIKNGYLGTATVYFAFRGHTNADAYAVVSFTGTLTN